MLIKSYLNKIIPSNSIFNKYVIILTSGTILANIIQVLSLPLLTQIYSPDAYGSFGIFISITTILSICVTLKYENAIMNEKYLKNYINIYILCILICLSISLIYFFILITLDLFIPNLKILYSGYFLIPLMTFSMGINTAYLMLKNKKKEYKSIAILSTLQVLTIIIFQIIAGIYYSNSSIMLIIGRLLGFSLITLFSIELFINKSIKIIKSINYNKIIIYQKKYKNYRNFTSITGLFHISSAEIPTLIINYFFGNNITGQFILAKKICFIPMQMLGSNIGKIFLQQTSNSSKENIKEIFQSTLIKLITLSLIMFLFLLLLVDKLFPLIFGIDWILTSKFIQIITIWTSIGFIASPLAYLFIVFKKQKEEFIFYVATFITRLSCLILVSFLTKSYLLGLVSYCCISALNWSFFLYKCLKFFQLNIFKKIIAFTPYILIYIAILLIIRIIL